MTYNADSDSPEEDAEKTDREYVEYHVKGLGVAASDHISAALAEIKKTHRIIDSMIDLLVPFDPHTVCRQVPDSGADARGELRTCVTALRHTSRAIRDLAAEAVAA